MIAEYSFMELVAYFFLYGFLGWVLRVACIALKERKYANMGLLDLPFSVPFGLTEGILLLALPKLDGHPVLQYLVSWGVIEIVYRLTDQFVKNISHRDVMSGELPKNTAPAVKITVRLVLVLVQLMVYLVVHPFVFVMVEWVPGWIVNTVAIILTLVTVIDYFGVHYALRQDKVSAGRKERKDRTQRIADRMTDYIWRRLEKAYPGVARMEPENMSRYVFAQGICFDKLVWVFLVSSFLGALIEMVFCRVTSGQWMNRSSVLYGTFSVVWGLGAVVLTVVLQRLTGKEDRVVFVAGAAVGGVYEYLCSVFTEIVFGTVFWDYSHMPLNIGGRINVLYCVFWGLLAVMWLKVLYPPMDRAVEKIPPLPGKIITWAVVVVMLFDGLLTAGAMCRYTQRQNDSQPDNIIEEFLDQRYDDEFMENRWPNMKIAE